MHRVYYNAHQRSVSDVIHGVEGSPAGDGGLVQSVAVRLAVVVVHREILHVHWCAGSVRLNKIK